MVLSDDDSILVQAAYKCFKLQIHIGTNKCEMLNYLIYVAIVYFMVKNLYLFMSNCKYDAVSF